MAVPSITKHLDVYEGKNIECAAVNIVDATDTELVLQDIAPINGNYVFQMVAKTNSGSNSLDISVGDKSDTIEITDSFARYILKFEDVNVSNSRDLKIVFSNTDIVYLQNLQLERATQASEWRPAPEDAVDEAVEESEVKAKAIVDAQTQLDIFNKLTNNGSVQGIYLAGGELYMNASYIRSGTISADRIAAGAVTISKLANDVSSVASSDEQLVYISKASGTTSVSAPTSYITDTTGNQNTWTTKRPQYNSSYPVLFIAKQKKSLNGTITCTIPQIDQTTTVIDGGHITTGTIDASVVTVSNLNASNITTGNMSADRITTGSMSANRISGGTLTLGGLNNGLGVLSVQNGAGSEIGRLSNSGLILSSTTVNKPRAEISVDRIFHSYLSSTTHAFHRAVMAESGSLYIGGYDINNSKWYGRLDACISNGVQSANTRPHIDISVSKMNSAHNPVVEIHRSQTATFGTVDENFLTQFYDGVLINGGLTVGGTKNRFVETEDYSKRLLYCYETPSPMFGDVGEGVTGDDGLAYVWIDPVFLQTISTSQYQVFLQKYDSGDVFVKERKSNYFIIEGTPNTSFGWELKAKQADYDQLRLEQTGNGFVLPYDNYGEDAAEYVKTLQEGRLPS